MNRSFFFANCISPFFRTLDLRKEQCPLIKNHIVVQRQNRQVDIRFYLRCGAAENLGNPLRVVRVASRQLNQIRLFAFSPYSCDTHTLTRKRITGDSSSARVPRWFIILATSLISSRAMLNAPCSMREIASSAQAKTISSSSCQNSNRYRHFADCLHCRSLW